MTNYYIDNSSNIYHNINNGIDAVESNFANDNNVTQLFEKASSEYIPAIFKINKESFSKTFLPEEIEYIDPLDVGITNKKAISIYQIYKANSNMIINKMQKVAKLLFNNHEDLAKYLSFAIKQASNSEIKNSHLTYDYILSKLSNDKKAQFIKEYKSASKQLSCLEIKNANKIALMSAIKKVGVKIE
jgi:hypothetical protein